MEPHNHLIESTDPLPNGSPIPEHSSVSTSHRILTILQVFDADDGGELKGGQLGATELSMLMSGEQMSLRHLYLYAIRNNHIYHTRPSVIITAECELT